MKMPTIVSPEEVARRTGIDPRLLQLIHASINETLQRLSDPVYRAKIDRQFYSGRMGDQVGFEWDMDHEGV